MDININYYINNCIFDIYNHQDYCYCDLFISFLVSEI